MTPATEQVDGAPRRAPDLVAVPALAQRRGVSKQALHKQLDRLERAGALETIRDDAGRFVSEAAYLFAIGERAATQLAESAVTPPQASGQAPPDDTKAEADRRRAVIAAELAQMELDERRGLLRPVEEVTRAAVAVAERVVAAIGDLGDHADTVIAAIAREGGDGARRALAAIGRAQREAIADALAGLADTSEPPPG